MDNEIMILRENRKKREFNKSRSLDVKIQRLNSFEVFFPTNFLRCRSKFEIRFRKYNIDNNFESPVNIKKQKLVSKRTLGKKRLSVLIYESKKVPTQKLFELKEKSNNAKFSYLVRKSYLKLMKKILNEASLKEKLSETLVSQLNKLSKVLFLKLTNTIFQGLISIIAIVTYIIATYFPDYTQISDLEYNKKRFLISLKYIEFIIAAIIVVELFFKYLFRKNILAYIFNTSNLIDWLLAVPTIIDFALTDTNLNLNFLRVLRFLRIIRVLRMFKIIKTHQSKNREKNFKKLISRKLIITLVFMMTYVFMITALIHYLHTEFNSIFILSTPTNPYIMNCSNTSSYSLDISLNVSYLNYSYSCPDSIVITPAKFEFDAIFYYVIITMTTVGYGDIFPVTIYSKVIIAACFMFMLFSISQQSKEVNETLIIANKMMYFKKYSSKLKGKHIIISGFFQVNSLFKFLNEFYNPEHKKYLSKNHGQPYNLVIVSEETPDKDVINLISKPQYEDIVFYIIGDLKSEETLKMIDAEHCKGIFLLSDIQDKNKNTDYNLILISKSVNLYSNSKIYVQFNNQKSLDYNWADWNYAFSSLKIKDTIMIYNSKIKGFSTFFMNLACTTSLIYTEEIQENPWMLEYLNGASKEIYIMKISNPDLIGKDFQQLMLDSFMNYEVLIIGIKKKINDLTCDDLYYYEYLINPLNYKISTEDELILIAGDEDEAKNIFEENGKKYQEIQYNHKPPIYQINENFNVNETDISVFRYDDGDEVNRNISSFFENFRRFVIKNKKINSNLASNLKNHFILFSSIESLIEFTPTFFEINPFETLFYILDSKNIDILLKQNNDSSQRSLIYQRNTMKLESLFNEFKKLVIIECDYESIGDLQLLNLDSCRHTFVLSFRDHITHEIDSGVIGIIKIIDEYFPFCKHTYELFNENNMKFLYHNLTETVEDNENNKGKVNQKNIMQKIPHKLWPRYATSEFFFSSCIDYLLPFSYHNKGLIEIIHKVLKIEPLGTRFDQNFRFGTLKYTGRGKIFYGDCVKTLLKLKPPIIPIAVYRNKHDKLLKNELPYLITNPSKNLVLNPNDDIIVLGKNEELMVLEYENGGNDVNFEKSDEENLKKFRFFRKDDKIDYIVDDFFDNLKKEVKSLLRKEKDEMIIYSEEAGEFEKAKLISKNLTEIYKLSID